jgi:hypothetical protein
MMRSGAGFRLVRLFFEQISPPPGFYLPDNCCQVLLTDYLVFIGLFRVLSNTRRLR